MVGGGWEHRECLVKWNSNIDDEIEIEKAKQRYSQCAYSWLWKADGYVMCDDDIIVLCVRRKKMQNVKNAKYHENFFVTVYEP